MKNLILFGCLCCGFLACQGQESPVHKNSKTITQKSPHENWTVHENYDEDGNLISKDSTYSYSYATVNGQEIPAEKMDSIFNQMHSQFSDIHGRDLQDLMQNFDAMDLDGFFEGFPDDFFSSPFFNNDSLDTGHQDLHEQLREKMKHFQQQFFQQSNPRSIPRETPDQETEPSKKDTHLKKV